MSAINTTSPPKSTRSLDRLRTLLGDDDTFLPCPPRTKGPAGITGWNRWTVDDTERAESEGRFENANIALLLGERTGSYCLDFDDDTCLETFLDLNADLRGTFTVRGQRGAKLIVRADTPLFDGKDVTADGRTVCELLQGNATIAGTHPAGMEYTDNGKPALAVSWDSIQWPEGWRMPGQEKNGPDLHRPDPIILPSSEEPAIQPAAESIFNRIAITRTMFIRGGRVVELGEGDDGGSVLAIIPPAGFCSRLENYGAVMKWASGGNGAEPVLKPASCSKELAEKLLAAQEADLLPRITSIVTGPVPVEKEGVLLPLGNGFHDHDSGGGILVRRSVTPEQMTLSQAVAVIDETLSDFRFVTDSDRARAVAFLLSPAMKRLIGVSFPIFIVEAADSQTGKGYLVSTVAAICGERPSLVGQRNGGVGGFDESLGARLIEGRPFILFDNLKGKIDSAYLEMILTAPGAVPCRIPHRGEISVDVSGFTFALTSNGVETTRDLANRANVIRLRKREDGRFTEYPEGDLLEHIRPNRGRFIGAVFTVMAEWISRGKPLSEDYRGPGAFRTYWRAVDYVCKEILGTPSPVDGLQAAAERTANPALQWLREICLAIEGEQRIGEEFSATGLVDLSQEHGLTVPGMRAEGAGAQKIVGGIMKRIFKDDHLFELDDWTITREQKQVPREDGKGFRKMNFYTAQKV